MYCEMIGASIQKSRCDIAASAKRGLVCCCVGVRMARRRRLFGSGSAEAKNRRRERQDGTEPQGWSAVDCWSLHDRLLHSSLAEGCQCPGQSDSDLRSLFRAAPSDAHLAAAAAGKISVTGQSLGGNLASAWPWWRSQQHGSAAAARLEADERCLSQRAGGWEIAVSNPRCRNVSTTAVK